VREAEALQRVAEADGAAHTLEEGLAVQRAVHLGAVRPVVPRAGDVGEHLPPVEEVAERPFQELPDHALLGVHQY
jgi:hypothetical protein